MLDVSSLWPESASSSTNSSAAPHKTYPWVVGVVCVYSTVSVMRLLFRVGEKCWSHRHRMRVTPSSSQSDQHRRDEGPFSTTHIVTTPPLPSTLGKLCDALTDRLLPISLRSSGDGCAGNIVTAEHIAHRCAQVELLLSTCHPSGFSSSSRRIEQELRSSSLRCCQGITTLMRGGWTLHSDTNSTLLGMVEETTAFYLLLLIFREYALSELVGHIRIVENAAEGSQTLHDCYSFHHDVVGSLDDAYRACFWSGESRSIAYPTLVSFISKMVSSVSDGQAPHVKQDCSESDTEKDNTAYPSRRRSGRDCTKSLSLRWEQQTALFDALRKETSVLRRRSTFALLNYLYLSAPSKMLALGVTSCLSIVGAKVAMSGLKIRREAEIIGLQNIGHPGWGGLSVRERLVTMQPLGVLIMMESIRMLASVLVGRFAEKFTLVSTSYQREQQKIALYRQLVLQPLSFFDLHSMEELEEVILYINSLEGVDVHVQTFVRRMQQVVCNVVELLLVSSWYTCVLALGAVVTESVVTSTVELLASKMQKRIEKRSQKTTTPSGVIDGAEEEPVPDLEELENGGGDHWLTGMDILSDIHRLRPCGAADVRLMEWWCRRLEGMIASRSGKERAHRRDRVNTMHSSCATNTSSSNRGYRALWSGFVSVADRCASVLISETSIAPVSWIRTLPNIVHWMLPLAITIMTPNNDDDTASDSQEEGDDRRGASKGQRSVSIVTDSMNLMHELVDVVCDAKRIAELFVHHGHKAWTLEKLRQSAAEVERGGRREHEGNVHVVEPNGTRRGEWKDYAIRSIFFRHVTFAYPSRTLTTPTGMATSANEDNPSSISTDVCDNRPRVPRALTDVSLSIENIPHKIVCISGPSGCGKTTLLNLLLHLYDVENTRDAMGSPCSDEHVKQNHGVELTVERRDNEHHSVDDGVAAQREEDVLHVGIHDVPHAILRRSIFGFVPQNAFIVDGTIAQNVALEQNIDVTDTALLGRIEACCSQAQCSAFVDSLPGGVLATIAPAGAAGSAAAGSTILSGGQAQRLMIARALFLDCSVLLMDEPTASLDAVTKQALISDLRTMIRRGDANAGGEGGWCRNRLQTIIAVTHDEALLNAADLVVVVPV